MKKSNTKESPLVAMMAAQIAIAVGRGIICSLYGFLDNDFDCFLEQRRADDLGWGINGKL